MTDFHYISTKINKEIQMIYGFTKASYIVKYKAGFYTHFLAEKNIIITLLLL